MFVFDRRFIAMFFCSLAMTEPFNCFALKHDSRKRRRSLDFPSRVYAEYRYATPTDRATDAHVNGRRQRRLRDPRLLCKYGCSLTRRDAKCASAFSPFSFSFCRVFSRLAPAGKRSLSKSSELRFKLKRKVYIAMP